MSTETLASRVELARAQVESELGDALDEIIPNDEWEHFTTDWYDRSIEVYFNTSTPPADPDGVARAIFALGFSLAWIHPHPSTERRTDAGLCRCPVRSRPKAVPT